MTQSLGNQFFLYESHAAYSIIRTADTSYRSAKTKVNKFTNELNFLISYPSSFAIKYFLRFFSWLMTFQIKQMNAVSITNSNFNSFKEFHNRLAEITKGARLYDISQAPDYLVSTVKEINKFMLLTTEYEKSLRLKLYPASFSNVSIDEVLEQRKKLDKFAADWDDDNMSAYDTAY